MKILVTGSSGYIGSRWATRLRQEGVSVVGLDRVPAIVALDETITADLTEPATYASRLVGIDEVHHLAAAKGDWGISEEEYFRDNLQATKALIKVAEEQGLKSWIFYSTVAVLGPSAEALTEESPFNGLDAYGQSKAACEQAIDAFCRDSGASCTTIRPSVVFGPGNPWNTNIYRLIDAIIQNRFLMIGSGAEVKTTSYVENLLDATAFLVARHRTDPHQGQRIVHYVEEPGPTTEQTVAAIYRALGKPRPNLRAPLGLVASIAGIADAAAAALKVDFPITRSRIEKFCRPTNFSGAFIRSMGYEQAISFEEAIARTVAWHLDEKSRRRGHNL